MTRFRVGIPMTTKLLRWPAVLLFKDDAPTRFLLQRCQLGILLRWGRHGLIILGIAQSDE